MTQMQVHQIRYFNDGDSRNYPSNITSAMLETGVAVSPIVKLGIQTIPGVIMFINDTPVMVGSSGVFELDMEDNIHITSLYFEALSLRAIKQNPMAYLIIDIGEEGDGNN